MKRQPKKARRARVAVGRMGVSLCVPHVGDRRLNGTGWQVFTEAGWQSAQVQS